MSADEPININDRRRQNKPADPVSAPEPVIPEPTLTDKFEDVQVWTMVCKGDVKFTYVVHIERGEKGIVITNGIDKTPVEVMFNFKDGTERNEDVAGLRFPIQNLLCYGFEKQRVQLYAEGTSPTEIELKRIADAKAKRAEEFERWQAKREEEFEREMRIAEGKEEA